MRPSPRPAAAIAVVMIAGALFVSTAREPSTAATNMLPNPGFERGTYFWSVRGGDLTLTSLARSGSASAVLTRRGDRGYVTLDNDPDDDGPSRAGTRCAASAWVRGRAGSLVRIRLREMVGDRVVAARGTSLELPDAVWHRIVTSLTVIGGGHDLDLNVYGVEFAEGAMLVLDDIVESCDSAGPAAAQPAPQSAKPSPTPEALVTPEAAPSPSTEAAPSDTAAPSPASSASPSQTSSPSSAPAPNAAPNPAPRPASGETVTVAAAGDIACDPGNAKFNGGKGTATECRQKATSDLVLQLAPDAVLPLGDLQYDVGEHQAFQRSYDPSWGRFKSISHPASGNHEYLTSGAMGYYRYWGSAAGDPSKGYYSYDIGAWHMIVLNTECQSIGGCGVGSPQERWLRQDLQTHPAECTLAYGHKPRWSSGGHGNLSSIDALWRALYQGGADVALFGHDHSYERFAPQSASGGADPSTGMREFVVGTGGRSLRPFPGGAKPNSERRLSQSFGVLRLTLHPDNYAWQFVTVPNAAIQDSGSTACH